MYIYCCPNCTTTIVQKTDDGRKFAVRVRSHKSYHFSSAAESTSYTESSHGMNIKKWGLDFAE